ncbi:MAG: hypothetical protein WBP73_16045, partial [Terriglobales bacterium]
PGLSRATGRRPVDTLRLADKAAHAPARSAGTIMAAKREAIRPAANPASAAVERVEEAAGTAVVVAVINRDR